MFHVKPVIMTTLEQHLNSMLKYFINTDLLESDNNTNKNNINMPQLLVTMMPFVIQLFAFCFLFSLAIYEVKIKFEARALQILLLNKTQTSTRHLLLLYFVQVVFYVVAVYFGRCSAELQAVAAYSLTAKLIQTNMQQLKVDILSIAPTFLFAFFVRPNCSILILESADEVLLDITLQVLPVLFIYLSTILFPVLFVGMITSYIVYCFTWFLVLIRRKFPEDFDFFLTLAIAILAFKTVKRDLVQRQVKDMFCSKLKLLPPNTGMSKAASIYQGYGGVREVGDEVVEGESNSHRILQHWCYSQDDIIKSIARTTKNQVSSMQYGEVEEVVKPVNMSYLTFYTELLTSYRGYYIMQSVSSDTATDKTCHLSIAHPPRETGLYGLWRGTAYKLYIMTSWLLPENYQGFLSVFGFQESKIDIQTEMECSKLNQQILVEKL